MDAVSNLDHREDDDLVFPDEIMTEILLRLPVVSLMRFRCVCKDWNSLFSNPAFIKLYFQMSQKNTQALFTFTQPRDSTSVETLAMCCSKPRLFEGPASAIEQCTPCYRSKHQQSVVGVCNGLACLIHSQNWPGHVGRWFLYLNPATRIQSQSPGIVVKTTGRHFIPRMTNLRYGFGYDDSLDTYKVVVMLMDNKLENWKFKIHCMGDDEWTFALTCPIFPMVGDVCGVFAGGTVNWLALKTPSSFTDLRYLIFSCFQGWQTLIATYNGLEVDITKELLIFSYDIKDNTYRFLSLPNDVDNLRTHEPSLGVLKGCMCLFNDHGEGLDIWIMREFGYEGSWTKILNLRYDHSQIGAPLPTKPLCVSEDEEVFLLLNNKNDGFVVYNRGENRIDYTEDFTENRLGFRSNDYAESLESPHRN